MMVVHRPPGAPSSLKLVLQRHSRIPVRIAADNEPIEPGICYIGEPEGHLTMGENKRARLIRNIAHAYRNRTIDLLFSSVAEHSGSQSIGVVLSGMLDDGSSGLLRIYQAGGLAMARVPCSSGWSDMPRNAIHTVGAVHLVDEIPALAAAVLRVSNFPCGRAEIASFNFLREKSRTTPNT